MSKMIPDVQGSADKRQIAITRVGICDIRMPLVIQTPHGLQHTVATAAMTVALPHHQKGTHMSRFIHMLNERKQLALADMYGLHREMLERLHAEQGTVQLNFSYFIKKQAPVSKTESLLDYRVEWLSDGGENPELYVQVTVAVTSLCPCSKEISQYGAHNQRSHIIIKALYNPEKPFELDELIRVAEEEGSCEIWSTLKRPDEKFVTERAYENPKFVEDIVRDVAIRLNADKRIDYYRVSSENFESIHNHSAYAVIETDKRS
ncbi:MAG: GTP cyclohydrolase FolE2 [Cardiobacteriaceae bacterium]|nr:GTP cyclohydrolase FolE2 [Cardiobacteriaceae bacterium]